MVNTNGVVRLTKDPERKGDENGGLVVLRVAWNEDERQEDGSYTPVGQFIDVTYIGSRADAAMKALQKGRVIQISGKLTMQSFKRSDGSNGQAHSIRGNDWTFVPGAPRPDSTATEELGI